MSNPSLLCVPYRFKTSKLYSQIPDSGLGDFTVTRATTPTAGQATRVNAQGFIELVADNVPRLDYPLGGITAGCPALLVEPSAQNLVQRSEEFNDGYWNKVRCTASANQTTAPDGALTADKLIMNNGVSPTVADTDGIYRNGVITSGSYRFSIFAKAAEFTGFKVRENAVNGNFMDVNLTNGAITNPDTAQFISPLAENYGNGWYRISWTSPTTITNLNKYSIRVGSTGNGTSGIFIWGYQVETGSIATSYIPTTTAAITRGAETISKTGVSSLIGQTEGTIYAEFDWRSRTEAQARIVFGVGQAGTTNAIRISFGGTNQLQITGLALNVSVVAVSQATLGQFPEGRTKAALAYDSNGVQLFVNGTALALGGLTGSYPPLNSIVLGNRNADQFLNDRIRSAAIYPTRLTNAQLQSLTQ